MTDTINQAYMKVSIDGVEYRPIAKIELMPMGFGEFLRATRSAVNLTLDAAAELIGCSKSYLWEMENGKGEPSLRMAKGISAAYGVDLMTLASYLKGTS